MMMAHPEELTYPQYRGGGSCDDAPVLPGEGNRAEDLATELYDAELPEGNDAHDH